MASKSSSASFIELYDALPPESQRELLEKHIAPLLRRTPTPQPNKVMLNARRLVKQSVGMPKLDLKAKKLEIQQLLDALNRDTKRAFIKERSNKDALASEIIDSLTDWLNDIWIVVYEFKANFLLAHSCLLFVATTLAELSERTGCNCIYNNLYVQIVIKNRERRTIKIFNIHGAEHIDRPLLWIWRDLFLSLLSSSHGHQKDLIPEMLGDIEHTMNWKAVERVLYGGKLFSHDTDGVDDDDEIEDCEDEEDYVTDSEDGSEPCPCHQHASHWSKTINLQRRDLRELVQEKLLARFSIMPSYPLHCSLLSLSSDPDEVEDEMQDILTNIATSSSDTFAAALSIYSSDESTDAISDLLSSHYHLLRPRDAPVLQTAVYTLIDDPDYTAQGMQIIEKELMETARTLHAVLRPLFHNMGNEENKQEITQIAKLRPGSAQRRSRVDRWVDKVITPARGTPNPMAIAAFMIGLPIPGGLEDEDDTDPLGYLDQADADLDDLREELRPKLQARFQEWASSACIIKGGNALLMRVYTQILTLMPFFRVSDVVDEMISRLSEKPSKHFVCDALDAIANFCKLQKKELAIKVEKKKKRAAAAAAASDDGPPPLEPVPSSSTSSPSTYPSLPPPPVANGTSQFAFKMPPTFGGMDDVD